MTNVPHAVILISLTDPWIRGKDFLSSSGRDPASSLLLIKHVQRKTKRFRSTISFMLFDLMYVPWNEGEREEGEFTRQ